MAKADLELVEASDVDASLMEEASDVLDAVNLDEVTTDTISVRVRVCKTMIVTDDEGNPILDEDTGKPLKYRAVVGKRTARLQLIVPMSIYNQAIAMRHKLSGENMDMEVIADILLKIWQVSEPFMNKQMLSEAFDDGTAMVKLFQIFFARMVKMVQARRRGGA